MMENNMCKILYILSYPIIWILNIIDNWREFGFKRGVWCDVTDTIENFFWEYHHNGIYGPGGRGWRTFKSGNLALLISILLTITFIVYIFIV